MLKKAISIQWLEGGSYLQEDMGLPCSFAKAHNKRLELSFFDNVENPWRKNP